MTTAAAAPAAPAAAPAATPVPPATAPADATKPTSTPPAGSGQPSATPQASTPVVPAASSQPADGTTKAPADGAKPADSAKPADGAGATLKLPEGSLLNEADLEDIQAFAKEKGLTPEQTSMLVERESLAVGAYKDSLELLRKQESEGWEKECREDKEFGGQKYPESSEAALRAVKAFFPDLADELNQTKYGSYPKLWKGLVRLGLSMKDDTVPAPTVAVPQPEDLPFHERLYGKDGFGGGKK